MPIALGMLDSDDRSYYPDNQNSQRAREGGSSMQEFLTIPADNAFVGVVT